MPKWSLPYSFDELRIWWQSKDLEQIWNLVPNYECISANGARFSWHNGSMKKSIGFWSGQHTVHFATPLIFKYIPSPPLGVTIFCDLVYNNRERTNSWIGGQCLHSGRNWWDWTPRTKGNSPSSSAARTSPTKGSEPHIYGENYQKAALTAATTRTAMKSRVEETTTANDMPSEWTGFDYRNQNYLFLGFPE